MHSPVKHIGTVSGHPGEGVRTSVRVALEVSASASCCGCALAQMCGAADKSGDSGSRRGGIITVSAAVPQRMRDTLTEGMRVEVELCRNGSSGAATRLLTLPLAAFFAVFFATLPFLGDAGGLGCAFAAMAVALCAAAVFGKKSVWTITDIHNQPQTIQEQNI